MKTTTHIHSDTAFNKSGLNQFLFNGKINLKAICLIIVFTIVMAVVVSARGLETISPEKAHQLIMQKKDNPDFIIIDIRTPMEFESGHIENAELIDYYSKDFLKKMKKLDKNKIYLIYCRSANRSTKTLSLIKDMGFISLFNMDRGIIGWKKNGYKIVK
ncbi:MAG: rhodanese-like domain-containing protein [Desulfobacula sp.]|nr:rhodanese-like domain-containing protein [Desulfobacula sp.]